jgi:hypothetical protein
MAPLGKLENCPTVVDVELADDVVFGPEHIIDINVDEADVDLDEWEAKQPHLLAAIATLRTKH